jgi:DNA-directed RNA polymerase specialized sigma24 family protein
VRGIAARVTLNSVSQEDLVQECLIHLWKLEKEQPDQTVSWYLTSCRFHLQHCLASGRSVDSPKRAGAAHRITIDALDDDRLVSTDDSGGEVCDELSAQDVVSTLARHLKPRERIVLLGLSRGLMLREVAAKFKLSYPTALKYRRRIASLTLKLGLCSSSLNRNRASIGVVATKHRRCEDLPSKPRREHPR